MSKQQLGDLDFQNVSRILNLLDPTAPQHAATKAYVDSIEPVNITTADLTNTSNTTLVNVTALQFPVVGGQVYLIEGYIIYRSSVASNGGAFTFSIPTGTIVGRVSFMNANDGTAASYDGNILANGDVVTSTGVATANTDYMALVQAAFYPTVSGNITPQFRSEVNGATTTLRAGSMLKMRRVL